MTTAVAENITATSASAYRMAHGSWSSGPAMRTARIANGYAAKAIASIATTAANARVDRRRTGDVLAVRVAARVGRESPRGAHKASLVGATVARTVAANVTEPSGSA